MHVGVVGTGYVGLVSGVCLADSGHTVVALDIDQQRIDSIARGQLPIYEPGLQPILQRCLERGNLRLTTNPATMLANAEVVMIAVGTPTDPVSGSADLSHVRQVAITLGELLDHDCVVVNKSTVPVGSCTMVQELIDAGLAKRGIAVRVEVASNPEFLKEGSAVEDFLKPDRIVIGCRTEFSASRLRDLYQPFNRNHNKILCMDPASAELTKYAANCLLATKISFINQLAGVAEKVGANIEMIRHGIGADPRIGYHFIYPGLGYGGSCFPKDVRALIATIRELGLEGDLLQAVEQVNQRQKQHLFAMLGGHFSGRLKGLTIAIWGLAFKPNTDDIREAPSLEIISKLAAAGAQVQAYDPQAMPNCQAQLGELAGVRYMDSANACLQGCDALVVCTEWREFRSPDWTAIAPRIAGRVVFDGRNLYISHKLDSYALSYYAVGIAPRLV